MSMDGLGERIPRIVLSSAVIALTVFQIALTWEFWGSFGEAKGADQGWVFQGIGVSLAIIEAFALVVAMAAARRVEIVKAGLGLAVFLMTFAINLSADISAISLHSAADGEIRAQAVAAYDAKKAEFADLEATIVQRRTTLQEQKLDLPAEALAVRAEAVRGRIQRLEQASLPVPESRRRELARLEAARLVAAELATATARHGELRSDLAAIGARPAESHAQFATISKVLTDLGYEITPEDVRVWSALYIGVIVKLWMAFGLWLASAPKDDDAAESDDRSGSLESMTTSEPPAGPAEAKSTKTEPVDFRQAARERRARQRELA
ncbi:MAG: hypothetical protein ACOYM8_11025, partial [Caulobacterales bacterium]